jgi:hypothetical protein
MRTRILTSTIATLLFIFTSCSSRSQATNQELDVDSLQSILRKFVLYDRIIMNTFNIQGDSLSGTCFSVDEKGTFYFFTAKHLFKNNHALGDNLTILMNYKNNIVQKNVRIFPHPTVDLVLVQFLDPLIEYPPLNMLPGESIRLGEDLRILGFPLNNIGTISASIDFYVPIVKRSMVSGVLTIDGTQYLALEGISNHGFSGGPVIAQDSVGTQFVCGLIVGYLPEESKVSQQPNADLKKNKRKQKTTELVFQANSGIFLALPPRYMREVIEATNHPMR